MTPVATPFFFYLISGIAIFSAIVMVTKVNPVHSALALIMSLLAGAGLYLMLYAPFMAGVQIVLYAGGILVMFLFVMMLVNIEELYVEKMMNKPVEGRIGRNRRARADDVGSAAARRQDPSAAHRQPFRTEQRAGYRAYCSTAANMGYYMFPFEIASILLLVAVIGAVVMAKRRV